MLSQDITNLAGCDELDPLEAPHIATVAAKPSEPRRHRQLSRSRSTSTSRSRSRRRRRTRRSRSSSSSRSLSSKSKIPLPFPKIQSHPSYAYHCYRDFTYFECCVSRKSSVNSLQMLGLHPQFLTLVMQLHQKHHQKLFLLCSHHTTHDHKSFHPRHHLSLQARFEQTVPLHLHRVFLPLHLHRHLHLHLHLPHLHLPRTLHLAARHLFHQHHHPHILLQLHHLTLLSPDLHIQQHHPLHCRLHVLYHHHHHQQQCHSPVKILDQ